MGFCLLHCVGGWVGVDGFFWGFGWLDLVGLRVVFRWLIVVVIEVGVGGFYLFVDGDGSCHMFLLLTAD